MRGAVAYGRTMYGRNAGRTDYARARIFTRVYSWGLGGLCTEPQTRTEKAPTVRAFQARTTPRRLTPFAMIFFQKKFVCNTTRRRRIFRAVFRCHAVGPEHLRVLVDVPTAAGCSASDCVLCGTLEGAREPGPWPQTDVKPAPGKPPFECSAAVGSEAPV